MHKQPGWNTSRQDYVFNKSYLESRRRTRHRRKQSRQKAGKYCSVRFCPRTLKKTWKDELKRLGWHIIGWDYKPRPAKRTLPQQSPEPNWSEPKFTVVVTSEDEPRVTQRDRDVPGHEAWAREELVRVSEAPAHDRKISSLCAVTVFGTLHSPPGFVRPLSGTTPASGQAAQAAQQRLCSAPSSSGPSA
ncbi:hypothetical protein BU23DRAFT_566052 [Bimuria novae-zelandiae CBS 107.79]|uniref:Uncharacterized protein n=1 Tax=Bimuria novae-zelandiae CBS 107.79 TaxID=1447943 RepID=A0A6A5VIB3_9PLEO|nr:hypothetical protein BU23DRAFT_566052 [Bimuria novae-zelandiae CBS 107.79]